MNIKDIKNKEDFQFQGTNLEGNVDFYITICDDSFVGEFFNKKIKSMKEAYIESFYLESETLEDAIKDCKDYILD